jgi:hypothetical protein
MGLHTFWCYHVRRASHSLDERGSRSMLVSTTMVTSHVRAADEFTLLLHASKKVEGGVSCCIELDHKPRCLR